MPRKYTPRQTIPPEIRFWIYVNKDGSIPAHCPELGQCWEWTAGTTRKGYGNFRVSANVTKRSHRVVWEMFNGEIPKDLEVCHKCDNPKCCNPKHLWVGTHRQNTDDMTIKNRFVHKITAEQADEIRIKYASGNTTHHKLALEYKISQGQVFRIIHHMRWNR